MRRVLSLGLLLWLGACAAPIGPDEGLDDGVGGKADGAALALEGTPEGVGVLRLLNDGETTDFAFLDDTVALDRRAAENLIAHRDGADATFGTRDDDPFDTIAEVDEVRYVGPTALERLRAFAVDNDYVPGPNDVLGTYDGVTFTVAEADRVIRFANEATEDALRGASVPSRAITSIVAARPIATVADLASLYWVGSATLQHLLDAVAVAVGGEDCETNADCPTGLRCTGIPSEDWLTYGKCRDTSSRPGAGNDCTSDDTCDEGLICNGTTVYGGSGFCGADWMRDTFVVGGVSDIPAVVMTEPTSFPVVVYGQATVPEDIVLEIDLEHTDPSSLWIGFDGPREDDSSTLWDGATMTGEIPSRFVDYRIARDDAVNGIYTLSIQNVGGRGTGVFRGYRLTVSSRWD